MDGVSDELFEERRRAFDRKYDQMCAVVEAARNAVDCVDEEDKRDALRAAIAKLDSLR